MVDQEQPVEEQPVEHKMLDFKIEGDKMLLTVDPNKDGEPVLKLEISLKEVPDEIIDAL